MKSEFLLAFNQICNERNLPRDVVLQALQTALVSAYRRSVNASAAQNIIAQIDSVTGAASIYVEKEVVEHVEDPHTEVSMTEARVITSETHMHDMIMVESTPEDFGRVAAQMAKQVILQRIREAERDALYTNFSEREGEIINGTVQSITPQAVALNLGRTEASLPKAQQVPGERYTLHQRLRAYVLEVRKSPRGPQIIVSRNHKNMLRRLLELEVPEIYNGTVEIKSIAREAGARSKIAVSALQAGVDPVGSCVGMKGVRIQSIVNELNGEKIDVIEWSNDPTLYIAKALSPARVLAVYADDDARHGKTAQVVVPDDQLSLAIGRDGQNARLAAKLTGWRIDIKSATEASHEIIQNAQDRSWVERLGTDASLVATLQAVTKRHGEHQLPWNGEELQVLHRILDSLHALRMAQKQAEPARSRSETARPARPPSPAQIERDIQAEALAARIPEAARHVPLSNISLSDRVLRHLEKGGLHTVADVLLRQAAGDEAMLSVEGIGPKALSEIKSQIEANHLWFEPEVIVEVSAPQSEEFLTVEAAAAADAGAAGAGAAGAGATGEQVTVAQAQAAEQPVIQAIETGPVAVGQIAPAEAKREEEAAAAAAESAAPTTEIGAPAVSTPPSNVAVAESGSAGGETAVGTDETLAEKLPLQHLLEQDLDEEDEDELGSGDDKGKDKKKGKRRDRKLVYDERSGKVIAQRERKPSRARGGWGIMDEDA